MIVVLKVVGIAAGVIFGLLALMYTLSGRAEPAFEVLLRQVQCRLPDGQTYAVAFEPPIDDLLTRGVTRAAFVDAAVKVEVEVFSSRILLVVTNSSQGPIEVLWSCAQYRETGGQAHSGLRMMFEDEITVVPTGKTEVFNGGPYSTVIVSNRGLSFHPMLRPPVSVEPPSNDVAKKYCDRIGDSLGIMLPIRMDAVVRKYEMDFRINDIVVVTRRGDRSVAKRRWVDCQDLTE